MKALPVLLGVLFTSAAVFAQANPPEASQSLAPMAWGLVSETRVTVGATNFTGLDTLTEYAGGTGSGSGRTRYLTASGLSSLLVSDVDLPQGVLITAVEVVGCNTSMNPFRLYLQKCGLTCDTLIAEASIAASAGCVTVRQDVAGTVTFDNSRDYLLVWEPTVLGTTQQLASGRVYYKHRVTAAPSSATFADVPVTHSFFKFVEALSASGITAGCGNGLFCINDPITRGEVAVWLAAALGLHHPN